MMKETPSEDDGSSAWAMRSAMTSQLERLSDPAPIFLPIEFDRQIHPVVILCTRELPHSDPDTRDQREVATNRTS